MKQVRDRWLPIGFAIGMVLLAISRGRYHAEVVSSDERPLTSVKPSDAAAPA